MLLNSVTAVDSTAVQKSEKVAEMIKDGRFEDFGIHVLTWGIDFAMKLILAVIIFFIGRWLINIAIRLVTKILSKRDMNNSLKEFLRNIIRLLLYAFLIIILINIVGTQTVSLAAIIGSIGLAIGLAVKDNLANFAGGVMLLFNKPFKDGDFIEAQNLSGTVKTIGILYTTLTTPDNKTIHIPNGPLSTGNIVNYNEQQTRRVDIIVNADYGADVEVVKNLIKNITLQHAKVLKMPEPFVRMSNMNDSSIDFTLRAWVNREDYWETYFDLNEEIYRQMNETGLNIPFPQLTVHLANPKQ